MTTAQHPCPIGAPQPVRALAAALLDGSLAEATRLVEADVVAHGQTHAVQHLLGGAMRYVGDAWSCGEVGVADEHVATAVATDCLAAVRRSVVRSNGGRSPRVLCVAPEGERHALPVTMAACVLEDAGCTVRLAGCDLPTAHVVDLARRWRPDAACITVTMDDETLLEAVALADALADLGVRVAIGGSGTDELVPPTHARWEVPGGPLPSWFVSRSNILHN